LYIDFIPKKTIIQTNKPWTQAADTLKTPLRYDVMMLLINSDRLPYKPIALVTLDTVFDKLPIIMLEVVSKLCVGDIFLTSDVLTMSQSSGTSKTNRKCETIQQASDKLRGSAGLKISIQTQFFSTGNFDL